MAIWKAVVLAVLCLAAGAVALALASSGGGSSGGGTEPRNAAVASGPRSVVWAVGDGADGSPAANRVVRLIRRSHPDRLLYLGDVYEDGTAAEYTTHYAPSWGKLARVTEPTPGNHEWPYHPEGYDPYWSKVKGRPQPPWFSVRERGWKILSLNSEIDHTSGSPQVRWLRRAVRGPGDCRIAFWHRPRFSAGLHGDQPDTQPLWAALSGKARIALWGHDHDMQRLKPRAGIVSFVSGAGGHHLYPVLPDDQLEFSNGSDFGALRLDLRRGQARYRFIAENGRVLDSGTVSCNQR